MKKKPEYWYNQSSVIPFRKTNKLVEVLIITTRKKKKWIFPKGIVDIGLTPRESAVKEALEEAGVIGNLLQEELGNYSYEKWGGKCKVQVFGLEVQYIQDEWEESFRERKWVYLCEIDKFIKCKKIIHILNIFNKNHN